MLMFIFCIFGFFVMTLFSEFMIMYPFMVSICLFWLMKCGDNIISFSYLGVDTLSWFLVFLSFWIVLMMLMASHSYKLINYFYSKFLFVLMLMIILLFLTFCSTDLISFYIFFEGSLIPIYLLIVGWGYQPERLQAGLYMILYTIFGSLPLLISIMFMWMKFGGLSFILMKVLESDFKMVNIWFFFSIFAFMIKLPAFFVHLWLPKAHVEAPVSGSMMLAGVLLKLGCYGFMRFMMMFDGKVMFMSSLMISLGLLGGLYVSFICLRQADLKSLIAYSSVGHMGLALGGLGSWGLWGFSSCLYICIAHGLCSSGLFYLSGVLYERSGSRSILINKGFLEIMPSMAFWWFMFCIGNLAAPIVLNLVGELGLLGSILSFSMDSLIFLMAFSFFGACYSLYLFSSIQHGKIFMSMRSMGDGLVREFLVLFLHFFPLMFLILEVDFMSY
uniref:NADH-ubiquinone oxidoreductase chain 4 n=1 Tax=Altiverruca navicula TaxID=2099647 RepID=A0A343UTE1_9CRUS|nr:NADH dehydrogenase subunit 4 [Altiverruca navicula]AVI15449.1 NADH dehydrogenase subunit 4 [Altiverruca navicula]